MWAGSDTAQAFGCGLTGAHRTGKTTVAVELAKVLGCPFVASSASQVAKEMGITKFEGMPRALRREYQEKVLETFCERYEAESRNGLFVSDRTPMDFAAYVLSEWSPGDEDPEHDAWVVDYVERCKRATSRYFFQVAVVQPGIEFKAEAGKGGGGKCLQEALNTLSIGLIADPAVHSHMMVLPRWMTDNDQRVQVVASVFGSRFSEYASDLAEVFGKATQ